MNSPTTAPGAPALKLVQTLSMPDVAGRIDHLAIDLKGQRLFVAALENNIVEVLDLKTAKVIHTIENLSEPQGVLFLPEKNQLFVANGGTGLVQFFDGMSYAEVSHIQLTGDADNARYVGKSVIVGYGDGGIVVIDPARNKVVEDISLSGHPESFQVASSGKKIFVNIPTSNQIAVADLDAKKVTDTWFLTSGASNFPMALDETNQRLFVGLRLPAKLAVLDTGTGKEIASFGTGGDVDDIFYDAARKLVFVIGGEGYIDLFAQKDANHYEFLTRIPTRSGARTGLWSPEQNRLYIAAPAGNGREAQILVYELQP
jgi:YVTN family beta-propeller protein